MPDVDIFGVEFENAVIIFEISPLKMSNCRIS